MCQSNVYLVAKDGSKTLLMEDVSQVRPENNDIVLTGILGEEKKVKGRIKELLLTDHQILIEE